VEFILLRINEYNYNLHYYLEKFREYEFKKTINIYNWIGTEYINIKVFKKKKYRTFLIIIERFTQNKITEILNRFSVFLRYT